MQEFMSKVFKKLDIGDKLKENFLAILIVAASGAIIYGLPYFRYDYYDVYLETYNLTNTQMGYFGSIFGIFGMISYLFGGFVADKFSTRKVLTVSLILTGLGGFAHLLPLSFTALLALYSLWGFTSLFAFWPACVKAVRILSGSGDQGKAFGLFESARGITAAIMTPLAILAFRIGVKRLDDNLGMKYIIIFYSLITILSGILVYLKMEDDESESGNEVEFKDLGKVLKMPAIWIISIITFCTYVFTMSVYYFIPYGTSILGLSVVIGATLGALKRYITPFSSFGGGVMADKIGTEKLLFTSFLIISLCVGGILLLPHSPKMAIPFTILYLVAYFFFDINNALTWAMMDEGGIPVKFSGTAAGVISTIGYLPEIFVSLLAGKMLDKYPGVTGYRYFFFFLIFMMLLGMIFVVIWSRFLKKNKLSKSTKEE